MSILDQQIDRLVDGELSPSEYTQLLADLEQTPGGWRRCALAFLEAQAWQVELGSRNVEPASPCIISSPPMVANRYHLSRFSTWHTLAASLTLGLVLGLSLPVISRSVSTRFGTHPSPSVVSRDQHRQASAHEALKPTAEEHNSATTDTESDSEIGPDRMALVVNHDDGEKEVVELPLVTLNNTNVSRLLQPAEPLPPGVQRMIRRAGYQVQQQRQFTPVDLNDGRQAILPVDQFDIVPVNQRLYH